jgi:hypothetical protein
MSASNYSYTPASFRLLAIEQGVDITSCLALAGLSNEDFDRQDGLITVAQYTAVASCAARKIGVERTPGRLFELIWNLGAGHGLILFRLSRNSLDVLKAYATYARVLSVVEVEIKLSATTVEIIQHPLEEDSDFNGRAIFIFQPNEENGFGAKAMIDEERQTFVQTWLVEGKLAKAEIAFCVGYADINPFYRALSRWRASSN